MRWHWLCVLLVLIVVSSGQSGVAQPGIKEKNTENLILLPRVGVGVEYGGFLKRPGDFASFLRRRLEIDLLQYGKHIFYLNLDEETLFGTPLGAWDFNQIRHRLNLFGYRYDLGEHYLGLFINHWCFNVLLIEKLPKDSGRLEISTYFLTAEFLSKTLRLGMKDRGIVFDPQRPLEFFGKPHFGAWIGRLISENDSDPGLDWILSAQLRYDIFRYRRLIPYLEFTGELRLGGSTRFSPRLEAGVRFHLRHHVDLTPFFQWGRSQELLKEINNLAVRRVAQTFVFGGMRVEALLDRPETGNGRGKGWQLLPEIHGQASYFHYPKSRFFGWGGTMDLDFEVLRCNPWTLFFYSQFMFDTRKHDFGMTQATFSYQYGLTYRKASFFAEGFVEHARRMEVNTRRSGISERRNLAGLRLGTQGMKPGHVNYGISFSEHTNFQWLHNFQAQGSLGHFFNNRNWQYLWGLTTQARWDVCRWHVVIPYIEGEINVIPYIEGEINWLSGGGGTSDAVEYAVETGLRLHGVLDLGLYYRFQHRENALFFRGPADDQSLVGIKALF